jgi:hypothetical protein
VLFLQPKGLKENKERFIVLGGDDLHIATPVCHYSNIAETSMYFPEVYSGKHIPLKKLRIQLTCLRESELVGRGDGERSEERFGVE